MVNRECLIIVLITLLMLIIGCFEDKINLSPIPIIDVEGDEFLVGEKIYLSANSSYDEDGNIVKYEWEYGNNNGHLGNLGNKSFVDVIFHSPGIYTIILTVVDNNNGSDSTSIKIEILDEEKIK